MDLSNMNSLYGCAFCILLIVPNVLCWSSQSEHELRNYLFDEDRYHRLTRPQEQTVVDIALNIITINDLDMLSQTISMTGWLTVEWTDGRLNWTAAEHNGINHIYAEDEEIWKPELFVDNSMSDVAMLQDEFILYRVKNTGRIRWEIPRIFQTHCEIVITHYPFDTQKCAVQVTSWTYTKDEILLNHSKKEIDVEDIKPNGEWVYIGSDLDTNTLHEHTSDGLELTSQLAFYVVLERRAAFYLANIVMPILLTSFLNVLVFFLPADSGEKVSYSLTMLLTTAVFLTLIADSMPNTSLHISILSIYITITLLVGVFCVLGSVITLKLHFKGESLPPHWAQKLTNTILVPITCWYGCGASNKYRPTKSVNGECAEECVEDGSPKYTFIELSAIVDRFFLVTCLTFTILSTVIFMIVLEVGGAQAAHI